MKRTLCGCALLAVGVLSAGCGFKVLEDIGSDPHPPTVEIRSLFHYVPPPEPEPEPEPEPQSQPTSAAGGGAARTAARSVAWNSGGFTVTTEQRFMIITGYTDAGADIVGYKLRDRDGSNDYTLTPPEGMTYFPDTQGEITHSAEGIEMTGVFGPHRMELWAEDSHGSRSEKVEFVITFAP